MRGSASPAKDVNNDHVDGATKTGWQFGNDLAGIPVAIANVGAPLNGQVRAHEIDEVLFEFDDLLSRTRASGFDKPGESQPSSTEVNRSDRRTLGGNDVNHVTDATHILKKELVGLVDEHVRLGRTVDVQYVGTVLIRIRLDCGDVTRKFEPSRGMRNHAFRLLNCDWTDFAKSL